MCASMFKPECSECSVCVHRVWDPSVPHGGPFSRNTRCFCPQGMLNGHPKLVDLSGSLRRRRPNASHPPGASPWAWPSPRAWTWSRQCPGGGKSLGLSGGLGGESEVRHLRPRDEGKEKGIFSLVGARHVGRTSEFDSLPTERRPPAVHPERTFATRCGVSDIGTSGVSDIDTQSTHHLVYVSQPHGEAMAA